MRKKKNPNEMSLSEHVKELKNRLIVIIIVFLIVFIASYIESNHILKFFMTLGEEIGYEFIYLSPQEVIIQQFRLAGVTALICDLPVIVYQIIVFISPAIDNKKSFLSLLLVCIIAIILFLLGAIFAYKILLPFVYKFLYDIGTATNILAQISIKEYITLFITIETCMGIITELPLICIVLTKIGVLTTKTMITIRPYVIVIMLILSAIITPPDVVSQLMIAIPMICLYQLSIFICKVIKGDKQNE